MSAVRELKTMLVLEGLKVLDQIAEVRDTVAELNGQVAKAKIEVESSGATKSLLSAKEGLAGVAAQSVKTRSELSNVSGTLKNAAAGLVGVKAESSALNTQMGLVAAGCVDVGRSIKDVESASAASTGGIMSHWKDVEGTIKKVAAATTTFSVANMYMAADVEDSLAVIGKMRGEAAEESWKGWVQQAATIRGSSMSGRAEAAEAMSRFFGNTAIEDQQKFLSYLSKDIKRQGLGAGSEQELIRFIGAGRFQRLDLVMPGIKDLGIDTDKIMAQAKTYYENPQYMRSRAGMTQEQVAAELFLKEYIRAAETRKLPGIDKTLAEGKFDPEMLDDMRASLTNISITLGTSLIPFLKIFIELLAQVNMYIQTNPGVAQFLALSIALTSVVTSGAIFLAMLAKVPGVMTLVNLALAGMRVGLTLLAAHPIIAVLLILATILILLEQRTGMFSNALKALTGLSPGDLLNMLMDLPGTIGKLAGGVKIPMQLQGVGAVLALMSPIGWAGILANAMLKSGGKSEKFLETISDAISNLLNLAVQQFPFLGKVYSTAQTIWNSVLGVYGTLVGVWKWLEDAVPGAKKEAARQDLLKALATPAGKGLSLNANGKLVFNGRELNETEIREGLETPTGGRAPLPADIVAKYRAYQNEPDFTSDLATKVAAAVAGAVKNIPGLSELATAVVDLAKAVEDLKNALPDFIKNQNATLGVGTGGAESQNAPVGVKGYSMSGEWAPDLLLPHDVGGPVKTSGIALVHEGEEIPTARTVRGGKTTLDLINAAMSRATGGVSRPTMLQYNQNSPLIGDARIDNDMDIEALAEKLLWIMRPGIEDIATRAQGQYRG